MATIDLSTPPPPPTGLLDALPRRVALTLAELRLVAEHAGGAPLPFDVADVVDAGPTSALEGRLGASRAATERSAYASVLAGLHDPAASLARRGLLVDDRVDPGLTGALGLLATPRMALQLDLVVGAVRARAWHRQAGDAVAALSTVDGLVFDLAWLPVAQWPAELARVAVPPEDHRPAARAVPPLPERVDLPYELLDAAAQAHAEGRADLVDVLLARHRDGILVDGAPASADEAARVLRALVGRSQGRLRGLVADVSGERTSVVGVVSWTLLPEGWRALRPHHGPPPGTPGTPGGGPGQGDELWVEVAAVEPGDLGAELAPVLAEVTR